MNEPRKAGRPRKHLQDEHHFRTSDDATAAGAPPAAADSGQADASDEALASDSASAAPIQEAVVENPTAQNAIPPSEAAEEDGMDIGTYAIRATTSLPNESPVEEKIHVMIEQQRVFFGESQTVEISQLNGWHPIEADIVLKSPPRNGMAVKVSETLDGEGVVVYWKRLRAFANATKRWQETGAWYGFHNGAKIDFEPKYWKGRYD